MATNGKKFLDFLKKINCPDVQNMQPESFDYLFERDDLKNFLDALCTHVTEENVLTPAEVDEYKALQAAKNIDPINTERMKLMAKPRASKEQTQKATDELKEDILHVEQEVKILERQERGLRETKLELLKKCEEADTIHKEYQKEITFLEGHSIPTVIGEVKSAIQETIAIVDECYKVFTGTSQSHTGVKPLFLEDFKPYLESEKDLLDKLEACLKEFVAAAELKQVDPLNANCSDEKQAAELLRLRKTLPVLEASHLKADLEVVKLKHEIKFYEDLAETGNYLQNLSSEELRTQLIAAEESVQQKKTEEEELLAQISDALTEKVDTQCKYVTFLANKDKLQQHKNILGLLEQPMDIIMSQRARLEVFQICLSIGEQNLKKLQTKLAIFKKHMENDTAAIEKCLQEQNCEESKEEKLEDGSLRATIRSILEEVLKDGTTYLTDQDLVKGYEKLKLLEKNENENSDNLLEQQLKVIDSMDKNIRVLNMQVHRKKKDNCLSDWLAKFYTNLGKFNSMIFQYEELLMKQIAVFQKKRKLIKEDDLLAMKRRLFIYALTNKNKFLTYIEVIEAKLPK